MSSVAGPNVQLRSSEYLTHSEASVITAAFPTSVIVVGGSARSGKTSLMAGVFSQLNKGPIHEYLFAGSKTLVGFEQRCHLATLNSGLNQADMERTKVSSEERFLHARLYSQKLQRSYQLLFCDMPGEVFRDAANSAEDCVRLSILRRADSFSLLIDGQKICDKRQRQSAFSVVESLIAQCLDQSVLGPNSVVQLIVSKWDMVQSAGHTCEEFARKKLERLEEMFRPRLKELSSFRIAVHAWANGGKATPDDFLRLLESWIRLRSLKNAYSEQPAYYAVHSEFDRFGLVSRSK